MFETYGRQVTFNTRTGRMDLVLMFVKEVRELFMHVVCNHDKTQNMLPAYIQI